MDINELTDKEKKSEEALILLTEKCDKVIKGRCVYNGKPTCNWLTREDIASSTIVLESVMLTATIDTHEERDVMTIDILNTYIHIYKDTRSTTTK